MLDETPAATLDTVLRRLNDALEKGDAKAAAALFQADSYWRDLVAFTWNLKTMEGPDQVRAMLESQLGEVKPGSLRLDPNETPAASGDVTEGWIEFETAAGRGYGHIRLKDGLIWTLLTTLTELKGFEEPKRPAPADGRRARPRPRPQDLEGEARGRGGRARLRDAALRPRHRRRPGRHRPRGAAAAARGADDHRRPARAARRPVAQALQVALPARPGLVRPPALHPLPGELAGLLAEGQDRRLAGVVHQGDGAQLLELDHREEGGMGRGREGVGRHRRPRTARRSCCGRSSWSSPPACRARRTCRSSPARTSSRASSSTRRSIPDPTPTPARRSW